MANATDALTTTNKRKQRVVKNGLVNIDLVKAEPGINYCNWIKITKQKLKERNRMLLQIKINKIQFIVNNELNAHTNKENKIHNNFIIKQEIIDHTLFSLSNKINEWNGVTIQRTKSSLDRYRDYFCISKKWWDQTKSKLFGSIFWLMVFKQVEQFVHNNNLLLNIIKALFNSSVKYNNTKPHSLINNGTIMCANEIHKYLYNIDNSLTINQWIKDNNNSSQKAKIITNRIQHQLQKICALQSNQINVNTNVKTDDVNYQTINNNNNNNINKPLAISNYTNVSINNNSNTNNNNNYNNYTDINIHTNSINNNINNININNNNNQFMIQYGGHHQPAYSVSDVRYSPLTPLRNVSVPTICQNNYNPLYFAAHTYNPPQYIYMLNNITNINNPINLLPMSTDNSFMLFQQ